MVILYFVNDSTRIGNIRAEDLGTQVNTQSLNTYYNITKNVEGL